jgi:hypothetical protein
MEPKILIKEEAGEVDSILFGDRDYGDQTV